ncbi:hypothetical protein V5O48_013816 [Marasmius crinis-equi]|uniref:F-box domain-containing protein n=1 Tax=Marasmius crinis-equi TaxID=585013 RepID=A0ABR3EZ20_9AGAR
MSSVSPPSTSLPIELVEQIMSLYWTSSLTVVERTVFARYSISVSNIWHAIFLRVEATDYYILGPDNAWTFLRILRGYQKMSTNYRLDLRLVDLCRSITLQHTNDRLFPCAVGLQPIGVDFRDIIQELSNDHSPLQLPFLRRISLELKNHLMESVFDGNTFLFTSFPKQVTELEINFTYGEDTDPKTIQGIKSRVWRRFELQNAKSARLKKLMVLGASSGVTRELLAVFGGSEKLESFKQDAWKEAPVKPEAQADVVVAREEDEDDGNEQLFDAETGLEPRSSASDLIWSQEEEEEEEKERETRLRALAQVLDGNFWTPTGYSKKPPTVRGWGEILAHELRRWTVRSQYSDMD